MWEPFTIIALIFEFATALASTTTLLFHTTTQLRRRVFPLPRIQCLILASLLCITFNQWFFGVVLVKIEPAKGDLADIRTRMIEMRAELVVVRQKNATLWGVLQADRWGRENATEAVRKGIDQGAELSVFVGQQIDVTVGGFIASTTQTNLRYLVYPEFYDLVNSMVVPNPTPDPDVVAGFTSPENVTALVQELRGLVIAMAGHFAGVQEKGEAVKEFLEGVPDQLLRVSIVCRSLGPMFYGLSVLDRLDLFQSISLFSPLLTPALRVSLLFFTGLTMTIPLLVTRDRLDMHFVPLMYVLYFYAFILDVGVSVFMVATVTRLQKHMATPAHKMACGGIETGHSFKELWGLLAGMVVLMLISVVLTVLDSFVVSYFNAPLVAYRESVLVVAYLVGFRFLLTFKKSVAPASRGPSEVRDTTAFLRGTTRAPVGDDSRFGIARTEDIESDGAATVDFRNSIALQKSGPLRVS
ncbi:hypothetical protein HK104_008473 [Borealophlyctis nickersoniae]|nr:hypothetical protein HK104_008473 [Borealophlyctis nickersoniae]